MNSSSGFSFRNTAKQKGEASLTTELLEAEKRLPKKYDDDDRLTDMELNAQKTLGLKRDESFIVIARLRLIKDVPKALHRNYLSPKKFPNEYRAYDLNFMSTTTTDNLVDQGQSLVIIALVNTKLHIRIFNANGHFVDKAEHELVDTKESTVANFKQRLDPFPDVLNLSQLDKQEIIKIAISIADYTQFLNQHDFAKESLVDIYNQHKFQLTSRDTILTARIANPYESRLNLGNYRNPILNAEQKLYAIEPDTDEPFVLEFMEASYVGWQYEIKNRPFLEPHTSD